MQNFLNPTEPNNKASGANGSGHACLLMRERTTTNIMLVQTSLFPEAWNLLLFSKHFYILCMKRTPPVHIRNYQQVFYLNNNKKDKFVMELSLTILNKVVCIAHINTKSFWTLV